MQKLNKPLQKQKGAALILMAFIISLAVIAYLLHALDPQRLRLEQDKKNALILAQSKDAIISYSVSRFAVGERPGDMPRPDYFATTEAPNYNYDGDTDGGCLDVTKILTNGLPQINTGANMRCLGRLPWYTIGMAIGETSQNDPVGNMPWYAVSANLVDSTCLKELNSSILNQTYINYVCAGVTLPHPWLTVRDGSGNIISNRVAVVLMIPNLPLTGQSRPPAPLNPVANYLDTITVPVGCSIPCVPGIYSNAGLKNEFIMFNQSDLVNNANDKLVYITIDELIRAVERRATQEAAVQLKKYYLNNSFYPYAANLGDADNACVDGNTHGLLPYAAICASNSSCTSSFTKTPMVSFTNACASSYAAKTGLCNFSGKTCTCTGAGSCTKNLASSNNSCLSSAAKRLFSCDALGKCDSNVVGQYTFTYIAPAPVDNTVTSGSCVAGVAHNIICDGLGNFSVTNCNHANKLLSTLPAWFTDNRWQDFIYYVISKNYSAAPPSPPVPDLTVGNTPQNVQALVIASGAALPATEAQPLIGQNRPSNNINDYLDSLVNTANPSNNTTFNSTSKMKTNNYNDQPLIVAP